jgi:chromosome segregation ATPase
MPSLEERVQALEKELAERKRGEEMLTIAVHALVSKEAFEKLQETVEEFREQSGKLFNILINQNDLHNHRLGDLQNQITDLDNKLDGKIIGQQTETRQRFDAVNARLEQQQTETRQRFDAVNARLEQQQTETRQRFDAVNTRLEQQQTETRQRFDAVNTRFETLEQSINNRFEQQQTVLTQILERLPEKP